MRKIFLISRDARTHELFRSAWIDSIERTGFRAESLTRRSTSPLILVAGLVESRLSNNLLFVYGVSEGLLLSFFRPEVLVVTGFGRLLASTSLFRKSIFRWLRMFYQHRTVVVLNFDDERVFRNLGFVCVRRISGEGVSVREIQRRCRELQSARITADSRLPSEIKFAYVGRLLISKGISDVLVGFNDFWEQQVNGPYGTLLIIGDLDFGNSDSINDSKLSRFVSRWSDRVQLAGFVSPIVDVLHDIDVVVSLSAREGLPFSVVEALSAGCRCVISRVPGHKDFRGLPSVQLVSSKKEFLQALVREVEIGPGKVWADVVRFDKKEVRSEIIALVAEVACGKDG